MQRIVVIGATGAGKSTLAEALAKRLGAAFIELDALNWEADWQSVSTELFRERVERAVSAESWVVGGNYSKARDLIWTRADTLIWLDYPFPLVFWRLLRRTLRRVISHENLWGSGNYETWRTQFFSRDSLFVWMLKTHRLFGELIPKALQQPEYAHLQVIRFTSPKQTERWLETVNPYASAATGTASGA